MKKTISYFVFSMFLIGVQVCIGQTSNQGAIVGTVTDANQGIVPSVNVIVTNVETGVSKAVLTDDRGNYRVDFLIPGSYSIRAEAEGFKRIELTNVLVHVSSVSRADIQLAVGEIAAEVEVSSDTSSTINTENATIGTVVNDAPIQNMPLNGREFIELSGLVQGVETW